MPADSSDSHKRYLNSADAASYIGLFPKTLEVLTKLGWVAHYERQVRPKTTRYDINDLDIFIAIMEELIATDPGLAPTPLREKKLSGSKSL